VLLLTGATGLVGSALLRRLTVRREPVRCLVRDPRRLGAERVRVQIAIGDLAEPSSFRNALRGVKTVIHLAASGRDQPSATLEEINGVATWRLLRAAERARVERFIFLTPLGSSEWHRTRVHRSKAVAERAVQESSLATTTLASSLIYAPGDRRLALAHRLAWLPAMPVTNMAGARSQPIWAEDVADCIVAALERAAPEGHERLELAGPQELTHVQIAELAVRAAADRRPALVTLPDVAARPLLRAYEALAGPTAFMTWDEIELLSASMLSERGADDARSLGVEPHSMPAVLSVRPAAA
jgi:NADH dehydrogenase